jgi:hypothetical protein
MTSLYSVCLLHALRYFRREQFLLLLLLLTRTRARTITITPTPTPPL